MTTLDEIKTILLNRKPLPSLLAPALADRSKRVASEPWNLNIREQLYEMQKDSMIPLFVIATLHLFNDDIGSCHDIVEKHGGDDTADYLHYILHRREGDYWNAKWWIRQLKSNLFRNVYVDNNDNDQLKDAQQRAQNFVDRCEQVEKRNDPEERKNLQEFQWKEMNTVLDFASRK